MTQHVTIYSTSTCPYCVAAKSLLTQKGYRYTDHNVSHDQQKYNEMLSLSSQRTVPQIVINGKHIGGYTDLVKYFQQQAA